MKNFIGLSLVVACVSILGCAERTNHSPFPSVSDETKADLRRPVNCATARQDVKLLEDERASLGKQVLSGVRSVFPIAAVAGILMGDYRDRVQVASGQYNRDLEAKIEQIKKTCNT